MASAIYPADIGLPRGRHALRREQVLASQRGRLLDAIAAAVADSSYAATGIAEIASRAGVSLRSFYENFTGKQDCFLAAYDAGVGILLRDTAAVFDPALPWRDGCRLVVREFLAVLSTEPAFARTFLLEIWALGAVGWERRARVLERFVAFHNDLNRLAREQEPGITPAAEGVLLGLVGAMHELVGEQVRQGRIELLPELEDDIMTLIVAVHAGPCTPAS